MNFDILEVFTKAGKIAWKYKILWIFGMFAGCGRSGSSGGNSNSSSSNSENPFSPEMTNQLGEFVEKIPTWFEQNPWIIFVFIAFVLISIVLQIFFTYVGMAGLMRGVVHAENGVETLRFGELFSESLKYFWRLFGAGFLVGLPLLIFLVVFIAVIIFSANGSSEMIGGIFAIFIIVFCCCLFPFLLFVGFYMNQVNRAIVVEDMSVFPAFARGWQVLTKNILGLILVGIIIFIGGAIIGILISLPAILAVVPIMLALIEGNITSWQPFILSGIFLLCYSPIAWFFTGVLTTYTESVWTLTYLRITQPKENQTPILAEGNA